MVKNQTAEGAAAANSFTPRALVVEATTACMSARVPFYWWGDSGTGKTTTVRLLSEHWKIPISTIVISQWDPAVIAGFPTLVHGDIEAEEGSMHKFAGANESVDVKMIATWGHGVFTAPEGGVFFDEFNTGAMMNQNAAQTILSSYEVGSVKMSPGVWMGAAGNPLSYANTHPLSLPNAARFCHFDWMPDPDWRRKVMTGEWDPSVFARPLGPDWMERDEGLTAFRAYAGLILDFLEAKPNLAVNAPDTNDVADDFELRGWPCERTWDNVARTWAAGDVLGISEEARQLLIVGSIGQGAASEFNEYYNKMDLPKPADILASPETATLVKRGDRVQAVMSSLRAELVRQKAKSLDPRAFETPWKAALVYINRLAGQDTMRDHVFLGANAIIKMGDPATRSMTISQMNTLSNLVSLVQSDASASDSEAAEPPKLRAVPGRGGGEGLPAPKAPATRQAAPPAPSQLPLASTAAAAPAI